MKFFIGLHFPFVIAITTILFGLTKSSLTKEKLYIFGTTYFLTVAAFSLTIEYLIKTKKDYFNFLYYEAGGYADKIFLGWLAVGLIFLFIRLRQNRKLNISD